MSRVVVVGAGMGGLAAAARLASLGHEVTVCERSTDVGGKLGRLEVGGHVFDTGPSLLTLPQVFRDLFADTGAPLDSVLTLQPVEPIARYRYVDGTEFDATSELDAFTATLDRVLAPGSGDDWRRFLGYAERVWDVTRGPFLESPLHGVRDLLALSRRVGDLRTVAPWRTLRSVGETYLRDPRLRMLLERYATYTGSDPRRAPAALSSIPFVEQRFGAWWVEGGLHRLAVATADRAVECGAAVRLDTVVSQVVTAGGRVTGVRLAEGEHLPADVVVANVDATTLYGRLVDDPRAARARRRLVRAEPSLSGFVLLLRLGGPRAGLAHHTVLFPADYDAEFDAVFRRPEPVPDPTVYVSSADATSLFVLVNAPRHGPVDWDETGLAERYAERILDVLATRGLDVRADVAASATVTPADLERRTGAVGGAIYGTSSNGPRAAFLRPANRSPIDGLYLVGGSSHPGGGLPLVTLSARIVAGLVGPA